MRLPRYLYLDRCGRVINEIAKERGSWVTVTGQSTNGSSLSDAESGASFNFNTKKYDISLEGTFNVGPINQEQLDRFSTEAEELHRIVYDILDLNEFSRIGFRNWYLFGAGSKEEACGIISKFGLLDGASRLEEALDGKIEDASGGITFACPDHMCRIGFAIARREESFDFGSVTATVDPKVFPRHSRDRLMASLGRRRIERDFYPSFGALIDVDTYVEDPAEFSPKQFIDDALSASLPILKKAIER